MNVSSVKETTHPCDHNKEINYLCERIRNFATTIFNFIKKIFFTIFCCNKKKKINITPSPKISKKTNTICKIVLNGDPKSALYKDLVKDITHKIKKNEPYKVYSLIDGQEFNLIEKLIFDSNTNTYYQPHNLFFETGDTDLTKILRSLNSLKTTNKYRKEKKEFTIEEILEIIKNYESDIEKNNFPRKDLFLDLLNKNKKVLLKNKITKNALLTHYNLKRFFCTFNPNYFPPFFRFYLMSLCKELAIINHSSQYLTPADKSFETTNFPKNKKYIAIFFSVDRAGQPHTNFIFINRKAKTKTIYYYEPRKNNSKSGKSKTQLIRFPKLKIPEFIKLVENEFNKKDNTKYTLIEDETQDQRGGDNYNCSCICNYKLIEILIREKIINEKILPKKRFFNQKQPHSYLEYLEVFRKTLIKKIFENPVKISKIKNFIEATEAKNLFIKNYPLLEDF
jgi:hypothetical protein